jgi:hypothetical protein
MTITDEGVPTVFVVDTANRQVTPSVKAHLRQLYSAVGASEGGTITVHFLRAQRQKGSIDCGLFALAYAQLIASSYLSGSELITEVETVVFAQSKLRQHLLRCFEAGHTSPFPQLDRTEISRLEANAVTI